MENNRKGKPDVQAPPNPGKLFALHLNYQYYLKEYFERSHFMGGSVMGFEEWKRAGETVPRFSLSDPPIVP